MFHFIYGSLMLDGRGFAGFPLWDPDRVPSPPPQLQEGQLVVRHFQFLRWSPYRDVPDSRKAFLSLLAQVHNWQRECGEGRTVVHCL